MIKARFGSRLDGLLQRHLGPALRRGPPPWLWSASGVAFSIAAGVAFADTAWRSGSLWIAASSLCDLLDGPAARAQGRASPRGAFIDSSCDRVSDLALYLGVMIGLARTPELSSPALLVVAGVALATAQLTSYLKARAEHWLPALEGGAFERGERLAVLGVGTFFGWIAAALWVLALVGVVTVATRFVTAWRALPSTSDETALADAPADRGGYPRRQGGADLPPDRPDPGDSSGSAGGGLE